MKVWRSGTSECSRASSRTSSSDGVSSRSTATAIQHLEDVGQLDAAGREEHGQVIEHVGGFLRQALVGLVARRPCDLLRLLLDLRADELGVREQLAGVRVRPAALRDRASQRGQRLGRDRLELALVEARARTGVARRAGRIDQREERVLVAVEAELLHPLHVARGLALVPELLARARPEPHLTRLAGALERVVVHVREREHLAGARVLDYAGQKLVHADDYGRLAAVTFRNSYVAPISSNPRLR